MRTEPGCLFWRHFCSDCGRSVATSAAATGGAPGPPKQSAGGNREGVPSPGRSRARSDSAAGGRAPERKKRGQRRHFRLQVGRELSGCLHPQSSDIHFWGNSWRRCSLFRTKALEILQKFSSSCGFPLTYYLAVLLMTKRPAQAAT